MTMFGERLSQSWNVVTWKATILGHVKCGEGWKVLELFELLQQEGVQLYFAKFLGGVLNVHVGFGLRRHVCSS
jgi:hypothetical protein